MNQTAYLDYNSTTPIDPRVLEVMCRAAQTYFGNAGSRTHTFGSDARRVVTEARATIAELVSGDGREVIFTSGATESNNLGILGLEELGRDIGKMHVVSTAIEHKAVLEPLEVLKKKGFEVELVDPCRDGRVNADDILSAVRDDTLLVSVMHVNNETGVIQPIDEIANGLRSKTAYFHVDAAQGYGKELAQLRNERIDLIAITSHKMYGPKGIGALVARDRVRRKLSPLFHGGGHQGGLRPGTLPVFLIVAFAKAAKLLAKENKQWHEHCGRLKKELISSLAPLGAEIIGAPDAALPNTLNFALPGVDSEAAILALKSTAAISNGSACTSESITPSHVVTAMLGAEVARRAVRLSWGPQTKTIPTRELAEKLSFLL